MNIVADIGGTNTRVAAASADALGEIRKIPTPKNAVEGVAAIAALAQELAGSEGISGFAGCIAADRVNDAGMLEGARNMRAWEGVRIVQALREALGVDISLCNDTGLAAVGETYFGAGRGFSTVAYVTVSTGVGGGLAKDGRIITAGGLSFIKVRGADLEDLVSGTAVAKKFGIEPKDLESLDERNALADILAEGLGVLCDQWQPEVLVLGGSMITGKNPIPIARVESALAALRADRPALRMAELGDTVGLWGAVAVLRNAH